MTNSSKAWSALKNSELIDREHECPGGYNLRLIRTGALMHAGLVFAMGFAALLLSIL